MSSALTATEKTHVSRPKVHPGWVGCELDPGHQQHLIFNFSSFLLSLFHISRSRQQLPTDNYGSNPIA